MAKVFFDHQKFSTQRFGGISRYFANIINEINASKSFQQQTGVLHSANYYLRKQLPLPSKFQHKLAEPRYAYKLNEWYCKQLLQQDKFDIFHPTYYDPYFIPYLKKPLIITIHDMTYERLPEYFWAQDPLTQHKRLNIERADTIIAISETTKKDLVELFDVDANKVEVIYHGIDLDTPLELKEIADLPERYLLFVGDRSGYKNFYLLMQAFKEISLKYPDLHLLLTGGGSLGVADVELIARLKLRNKVSHLNCSDAELNYLYNNAELFIYPSLYEGFGLPILEAFKANCPVLLSDTACFREVGADAVEFFSAQSRDDLIFKICSILDNSSLRQSMIDRGRIRLRDFPLEKSVKETLSLYSTLI